MNSSESVEVRMANEWYCLAKEDHFWIEWRFSLLLQSMKELIHQPSKILDIGCGDGSTGRSLEKFGPLIVDGCELNQQIFDVAKLGRGQLFFYDILTQSLASKNYDGVLMLDVIEHIEDDLGFLIAAKNHLKPDGKIFISVPAFQSLYSNYDSVAGHVRRYNKQTMLKLVNSAGLRILNQYYWGFSLLPLAVLRKFYLNFVSTEEIIQKGFEPPTTAISNFLKLVGKLERKVLPNPPMGTSLFIVAEKVD